MMRETWAIFFLFFVLVVLVVWALYLLFRKPFSPVQWGLYFVDLLLVRLLWRAGLPSQLQIPDDQGAVIICNHRSSIDPCFVQIVAGHRSVHWMVAQMYGQRTLIGWLLRMCEIIPVTRHGSDLSPTKAAIRLAAEGQLVGILPEGAGAIWDHQTGQTIDLYQFPGVKHPLPAIPSIEAMKVCPRTGDRNFKAKPIIAYD